MTGRVLIVAGSDSGGGAGIQADLKAVAAFGGYGMTAITAVTAQNTLGVFGVETLPAEFVALQMRVVLDDIGADAVKIGMLGNAEISAAVADMLMSPLAAAIPLVVDTVMVATRGGELLDAGGLDVLKTRLLPRAVLVTPNLPEAEKLTGMRVFDLDSMRGAAAQLRAIGAGAVLVKGGHLGGDTLTDLLVDGDGEAVFSHARRESRHTHGTGCVLSSAVAVRLAQGAGLRQAVAEAVEYVQQAIRNAPGLGQGNGPLGLGRR